MADNMAYDHEDGNQKGIEIDRTPHDLFIEMDELILSPTFGCFEWVEQSRWIKYEEAREEGCERWSKPHVSSLTFQSVINLKTQLERGLLLLDLQLADMSQILQTLVEQLIETGMLEKEQKNKVLEILLKQRTFVEDNSQFSFRQQLGSSTKNDKKTKKRKKKESVVGGMMNAMNFLQMTTFGAAQVALPPSMLKDQYPIMASLPDDAEGALTLCAAVESLTEPITAFIRLAESKVFNGALEIPLPLRFMFVVLTPKDNVNIDAHEVGRSFSTLMSSKYLQKMCYSVESKGDLLNAINDFLAETVVLPAANWADENLLSFHKIQEMEERRKRLKGKITEPYNLKI